MNTTEQKTRVIGLIRVSTTKQGEEGESLETQENRIRKYCEIQDLELVGIVSDVKTGSTMKRDGLREALGMLAEGKASTLMVTKLDRLTRSLDDWLYMLRQYFQEGNLDLMCVDGSLNTRTAMGRMVLNVLMSILQGEREMTGERTREILRAKRERGERVGNIPFGFRNEDGMLVFDEDEQYVIRRAKQVKEEEGITSWRGLGRRLDELGLRPRSGGKWESTSLKGILTRT